MNLNDFNFYELENTIWLQELIKEKLNPEEVFQRKGYTSDDVIAFFIQNQKNGVLDFLGSPSAKFCFRLFYPNDKVVEPHIMGDMKYLRTFTKQSVDFMFKHLEKEKINVYTHNPTIARLMLKFGFTEEGTITKTYLLDDKLIDIKFLGLNKQDYIQKGLYI